MNDQRSSFSNYGSCVAIFAPGSNIRSASYKSRTGSSVLSGTSMACPQVAGAVALLMEKEGFGVGPSELKRTLIKLATPNVVRDSRSDAPFLRVPVGGGAPNPGPPKCITIGGPRPNRPCVFPFQLNGKTYTGCTTDLDDLDNYWCSTDINEFGEHISGQWGYCDSLCPKDDEPLADPDIPTFSPTRRPTSDQNRCITVAGPIVGQACVFPFQISNEIYTDCTTDLDPADRPWCSVEVDGNGKHIRGRWGYCASSCSPEFPPPPSPSLTFSPTRSPTFAPIQRPSPSPAPSPAPIPNTLPSPCEILESINALRAKNDLPGLRLDGRLQDAAVKHAIDMASRGYFDHISPEGENVDERVIREGYEWKTVAENIAAGYDDGDALVEGWKASPGHFGNILCKDCTDTGIGAYYAAGTEWKYYYVQVFARTDQPIVPVGFECPPTPPSVTPVSCTTIGGPDKGAQCAFPFIYDNRLFSKCIRISSKSSWCSTATDSNRFHLPAKGKWGYCSTDCATSTTKCPAASVLCVKDNTVAIGESYGPVNVSIPSLTITGLPSDSNTEYTEGAMATPHKSSAKNLLWLLLLLIFPCLVAVKACVNVNVRRSLSITRRPNTPTVTTVEAQL